MHMADALISPAVGGSMWAVAAGTVAYCSRRVRQELDDRKVPLMGVLGAFVFAAQMINFAIPGTGSSGHLGGALLLAILLGPHAAFLVVASVLVVQALLFADGGLLALGCNIFNLGFFPVFFAYPFIYRKLAGSEVGGGRQATAAIVAAVAGLQLGAFCVVLETVASGISALPFKTFLMMMQPIHLAIGIVEGIVTSALVTFVARARPEILANTRTGTSLAAVPLRRMLVALLLAAAVTGGFVSWFASERPDGLEWSIARVTGRGELAEPADGVHRTLADTQQRVAVLPDYAFKQPATGAGVRTGTSVAGLVGALITLAVAGLAGLLLRRRQRTEP